MSPLLDAERCSTVVLQITNNGANPAAAVSGGYAGFTYYEAGSESNVGASTPLGATLQTDEALTNYSQAHEGLG